MAKGGPEGGFFEKAARMARGVMPMMPFLAMTACAPKVPELCEDTLSMLPVETCRAVAAHRIRDCLNSRHISSDTPDFKDQFDACVASTRDAFQAEVEHIEKFCGGDSRSVGKTAQLCRDSMFGCLYDEDPTLSPGMAVCEQEAGSLRVVARSGSLQ